MSGRNAFMKPWVEVLLKIAEFAAVPGVALFICSILMSVKTESALEIPNSTDFIVATQNNCYASYSTVSFFALFLKSFYVLYGKLHSLALSI